MKSNQNAGGQPPSAETSFADFLRTVLKRLVMWLAVRDILPSNAVTRIFAMFDLKGA